MYSVIMHRGSELMHTPRSRMMLGSFNRDIIFISFKKSFLLWTRWKKLCNQSRQQFTHDRWMSSRRKYLSRTCMLLTWRFYLHRLVTFSRPQVLSDSHWHRMRSLYPWTPPCLLLHKGAPVTVWRWLCLLKKRHCEHFFIVKTHVSFNRKCYTHWQEVYLESPRLLELTSPNWPSPSFSLNVSSFRGNSSIGMSFPDSRSIVTAGTAYVFPPVTPCRLTMSASA